jgi:ABC-type transport system involved in cytochrome bd biosynthesis fused ATPase/permease subunit
MKSLVSETSVGLLLFDEPSASLDPTAEHGDDLNSIQSVI